MNPLLAVITLAVIGRTAESCWTSSSEVSVSPTTTSHAGLQEERQREPHGIVNELVLPVVTALFKFNVWVNETDVKLWCVFKRGNITRDVLAADDPSFNLIGVVGSEKYDCTTCIPGVGMSCSFSPRNSSGMAVNISMADNPETSDTTTSNATSSTGCLVHGTCVVVTLPVLYLIL